MTFQSLGLAEPLVRAVTELGYTQPTPIQAQAIPAVLAGGDLMAGAQTGTGKTAGFTLPILHRLAATPAVRSPNGKAPIRALVLVPTRELAAQVEESVRDYGKYLRISSMVMFGGVNINPQIRQLKDRVDILVATPGRLLDHVGQRTVDLSQVEILVLDEADRMLDMGFIRDIRKVLALLPPKRQNLLFSATFSDEIKALADGLLDRPALIEVARRNATAELVSQRVMLVDRNRKREMLSKLIKDGDWHQVLVFTRTKHGANRLAEQLNKDDITAMAIHGNKSQSARTRALSEFKDGSLQVLVATDIAARGLDISELPHVVNYELPNVPEDYVHRIGRTGRAGASGEAISLVCIDEFKFLADIEKLIKRRIERETLPGFELDPNDRPEPIELGGMRGRMQPRRDGDRRGSAVRDSRDVRQARPERGSRPATQERPTRPATHEPAVRPPRDDRAARPARDDRSTRPASDERAARPVRDERASRSAPDDRASRPARDERAARPAADQRARPSEPAARPQPARAAAGAAPAAARPRGWGRGPGGR